METFYIKISDDTILMLFDRLPMTIRYLAMTIWKETSSEVSYIKRRTGSILDPVDMNEFVWIKLRSIPL